MTKLSSQLKRATAFDADALKPKFRDYDKNFNEPRHWASALDWFDGAKEENARLAPILEALGRLADAADRWQNSHCSEDNSADLAMHNALAELRETLRADEIAGREG